MSKWHEARMMTPVERFWSKVKRGAPNECWMWAGYRDKDGYGTFNPTRTTLRKAHRYAYELAHGPIRKGLCVCHRCDNTACVNVAHLFLGTMTDNDRDRDTKSRQARGERHGMTKLTAVQTMAVKRLLKEGLLSQQAIADRFGIDQTTVSSIWRGRTWKHL